MASSPIKKNKNKKSKAKRTKKKQEKKNLLDEKHEEESSFSISEAWKHSDEGTKREKIFITPSNETDSFDSKSEKRKKELQRELSETIADIKRNIDRRKMREAEHRRRTKQIMRRFELLDSEDSRESSYSKTSSTSTRKIFSEPILDEEELFVVSDEDGGAIIVNETGLYDKKPESSWICDGCRHHVSDEESEHEENDSSEQISTISRMANEEESDSIEEKPAKKIPTEIVESPIHWKDYFYSLSVLFRQKKYSLILQKLTNLYKKSMMKRCSYDLCNITPYNADVSEKYETDIRVNASFIQTENKVFIAASHPVKKYFDVFNKMVQKACDLIVCLCCEENDYFQPDEENGIIEENAIYRIEKSKNIIRIKFLKWEDFDTPDSDEFKIFYERYQRFKSDKPVLVHCKAGVGRTGTFILYDILKNMEKVSSIILLEELCKLRSQRNYLVYNKEQLEWIIKQFGIE